jgi:CubicO group peptidase (beta-lactamase class C family)
MAKIKISYYLLVAMFLLFTLSCSKIINPSSQPAPETLYFPPINATDWEKISSTALGWNETELSNLNTFLQSKNTKAWIILYKGKIVEEKYFGTFTQDSLWYWASAGKTMTAILVGIAQQEGLVNISNRTSQYLGAGWSSAPVAKENLITIRHQLTMTTGLDDGVTDNDCTLPGCLLYKADAGTRWAYHNAAYTLLDKVIETATGISYNTYFQQKVRNKIGMNGLWIKTPNSNNVLYSNARSMARFGLLLLNKGNWDTNPILIDQDYFNSQISTSQNLNLSYGYLTWLNGKSSSMLPTLQTVFQRSIIPEAPSDMFAALGKNDQKIYIVPSMQLVVIRMGNSAGSAEFALSGFDNELWGKLKTIIHY